jgi:hypothetical protein
MPFGEAILSWNRNGEADLAGYRVYYGTSPISLNHIVDIGLTVTPVTPSVTLKEFQAYGTLHFAVTAYDTSNNESAFSTVVAKAVAPKFLPMAWR